MSCTKPHYYQKYEIKVKDVQCSICFSGKQARINGKKSLQISSLTSQTLNLNLGRTVLWLNLWVVANGFTLIWFPICQHCITPVSHIILRCCVSADTGTCEMVPTDIGEN